MNKLTIFFTVISVLCSVVVKAETIKVWNNEPLTINIAVGKEVRVIFPTNVIMQVPVTTTQSLKSFTPNRQIVFWTASSNIDKARIIATAEDGQDVYVIDLSANENGIADNIEIQDPRRLLAEKASEKPAEEPEAPSDPAEVILTRFAAQSLYAPDRLIPTNTAIFALDTPDIDADFPLVKSANGESYRIEPIAQWQGYGKYITAILLINQAGYSVPVNGERVRGNFSNITAQHLHIGAKGTFEDRTTLYLISNKRFEDAVLEDGYGY